MIDARELPEGSTVETEVCIVGSGAAGITIASELAGGPLDVCLLEAGGWELDARTQDLYRATNVGLPYFPLDANRQRSFGGTTNLWAGWCRPLDDLDFEARPWVPDSGWPIGRAELLPYYERAHAICRLGPFDYDPAAWETRTGTPRLPLAPQRCESRIFRLSPPECFRDLYRQRVAAAGNVRLLLHANVLGAEASEGGRAVSRLRVGCLSGRRFSVVARIYVLAAGGIDNARLLLLSDTVQANGLGNAHDRVGRSFMEHLHLPCGVIALHRPGSVRADLYHRARRGAVARLFLPRSVQEEDALLHASVMLEPIHRGDGVRGTAALARALAAARRARRGNPIRRRAARLAGEPSIRLPRIGRPLAALGVRLTLEQAPNRDSRVTLSDERDELGARRVRLEWRTTPLEEHTRARTLELLDAAFRDAGLGHLRDPPGSCAAERPLQGRRGHHMGTTRMSADPHRGVVDLDCRVHGVANLFVAGSSVFPTSGAGTPTLTIVALAIRLAERIQSLK